MSSMGKCQRLFQDWLGSTEVNDFDKLKDLILLEHFKYNISPNIKLYIEDRREKTFAGATRLADEYSLTHNLDERRRKGEYARAPRVKNYFNNSGYSSSRKQSDFGCYICGKAGHMAKYCRYSTYGKNSASGSSGGMREVTCYKYVLTIF